MKKTTFSTLVSALRNVLAVFGVIVVAGVLGVVVAGAFAFHQIGGLNTAKKQPAPPRADALAAEDASPALRPTVKPIQETAAVPTGEAQTGNRPVADEPSDQPHFTYADYHIDVSRVPLATFVRGRVSDIMPPPLAPAPEQPADNTFSEERHMPSLSDPGSHYIIDSRTGRVVGIDGTAGAAEDARRLKQQAAQAAAFAQPKTVLPAIPVDQPLAGSDLPPPKPDLYVPVRRAMPVIEIAPSQPFSAAAEVSDDDDRPVMRAEPVAPRPTRRVLSLP